jgi:hypothetical protein
MEGISLGSAYLRLYGDRSALDRELEKLRRYTDQLEKQGIKVKFDPDTGQASRQIDGLQNKLHHLQKLIGAVGQGVRGDADAWKGLADKLSGVAGQAAASGGAMGKMAGALGGAVGAASKAIPVLGQLGMAAMGVQAVFQGISAAINGVIAPLQALSQEAGRFNQQVAEASIFATNAFAVIGPDGQAIQGTANQMRALRGTISKEYKAIQKEVAQISGATASEIYDGFNIILQNVGALGKEGEDLGNVRKLSTRLAAGMNTLGVPGEQLRSEMYSLLTGDVQIYDKLGRDLYGPNASQRIKQLQAEGKYYEDLMQKLEKLYDGQKVLSESLSNVASNFRDVFETISTEGGQSLERGLAKAFKAVLGPLDSLQGSFAGMFRGISEFLEPILKALGEIGGWFVSAGSAIASTLQVVMDILGTIANAVGAFLLPTLRAIGNILQVVAKVFQLVAALVSAVLRPFTVLFRILGDTDASTVDRIFQPIIDGLDALIGLAEKASAVIAAPFKAAVRWKIWAQGKLTGKSDQQIRGEQDEAVSAFDTALDSAAAPTLRSLKLLQPTEQLLTELSQRYGGSGSQDRALAIAKETSQLVQDRIKNEVQGLEQGLKLMQSQKEVQEALNQLAEGRRGLAMSRAGFSVQLASSPEARLAAEERRNDLAQQQEQQRIQERRSLLGTERQMLDKQLQIQLRQQQLQTEQLKIQRMELQVQRVKAQVAAKDIYQKMLNAGPGSKERQALTEQWQLVGKELQLRDEQIKLIDSSMGLSRQAAAGLRTANGLEQQRLDIQGQQLDVQAEMAGLTRAQQAQMAEIQRQEQAIKNNLEARLNANTAQVNALEEQTRLLEAQQKAAADLEKVEKARLEHRKALADAAVQAAEADLRVAQAQASSRANPGSTRELINAQIEALAAGTRGYVDEAAATKRLYDAKEQQLRAEQEMQRMQLQAQQQRERSELQIYEWRLKILQLEADSTQARAQAEQQNLQLQQQRDAASAGRGTIPGAPPAPVLPPPAGATSSGRYVQGGIGPRGANQYGPHFDIARSDGSYFERNALDRYVLVNGKPLSSGVTVEGGEFGASRKDSSNRRRTHRAWDYAFGGSASLSLTGGAKWIGSRPGSYGDNAVFQTPDGRTYRIIHGRFSGTAAPMQPVAGQPTTSLQNQLQANTTAINENTRIAQERDQALADVANQRAQLAQRQAMETGALGLTQAGQLSALNTERIRAQLTAQVLNSDRGRLALEISDAMSAGVSGVLRGAFSALREGGSIGEVFERAMGEMADRMIESLLDFALAPLQRAISGNTFRAISGVDMDALARQYSGLPAPAAAQGGPQPIPVQPFQQLEASTTQLNDAITVSATTISRTNAAAANTPAAFSRLNTALGSAMQVLGSIAMGAMGAQSMSKGGTYNTLMGLAGIFGAIGSIAGMFGTGGIFAGSGGGGGGGGLFSGAGPVQMPGGGGFAEGFSLPPLLPGRANGGPVSARQPYIVGEIGPELFVPDSAGTIIPNNKIAFAGGTAGAAANAARSQQLLNQTHATISAPAFETTRSAVAQQRALSRENDAGRALADALLAPADSLKVAFETTRINSVDYVTVDQFQRGMAQSAERGRALTLAALKNSVKTRRMVGV